MSVPPPPGRPDGPQPPGQPYGLPFGGPPAPPGGQPPAGNAYGPPPGGGPPPFSGQPGAFAPPPGQPGGFAPPPGQPYGPPPGQPVQGSKKLVWLRIVVAVIVLGAIVAFAISRFASSPASAAVGDCLHVKEFSDKTDPSKVDCKDPTANVKIAVKLDSDTAKCPQGDYDEYSVSGRSTSYKLCLMPNVAEGDCVADFTSDTAGYEKVPCLDPRAEVKVAKVVSGSSDGAACDAVGGSAPITYSDPKSTYCYTKVSQNST